MVFKINWFMILVLSVMALLTNVNAWSVPANQLGPNYLYYVNITNITFGNYSFPTNGVANIDSLTGTQWFLYNTSSNTILSQQPIQSLLIEGFNSSGYFEGNIVAFPYPTTNGLLIYKQTVYGKPYNSVTIFFGQGITQSTYLGNFTKTHIVQETQTSGINNNLPIFPFPIVVYNTSALNGINTTISYQGNGSSKGFSSTYFNLNAGYLLLSSTSNTFNMSLKFIPNNYGSFYSNLNIYSNSLNIMQLPSLSIPFLGGGGDSSELTVKNNNDTLIYMNPNPCQLNIVNQCINTFQGYWELSHNIKYVVGGPLNGGYAYNLTNTDPRKIGIFTQPYYNGKNYQFQLTINYTNILADLNRASFYLIPTYSASYTSSNAVTIPHPTYPNVTSDLDIGKQWQKDYNYRSVFYVNNWNFRFLTYAYSNVTATTAYLNKSYVFKLPNSPYLLLTAPHYTGPAGGMQTDCSQVFFEAYNDTSGLDSGPIPFAIVDCNPLNNTVKFILSNQTAQGNVYNQFNMYYESRHGLRFFNNQGVLSAWETIFNGGASYQTRFDSSGPVIFNLSAPLNAHSWIATNNLNVTGWTANQDQLYNHQPDHTVNSIQGTAFLIDNRSNNNEFMIGRYIFGKMVSVVQVVLANRTSAKLQLAAHVDKMGIFNFTTNINAEEQHPYTTNVTQGPSYVYQNNQSTSGLPLPPIPIASNKTPITPGIVSAINLSDSNLNNTLSSLGLDVVLNLYGLNMPTYVLDFILLFFALVAIGLTAPHIADTNLTSSAPLILIVFVLFIAGLWNFGFGIIALFIVLIYMGYEFIEHHK